MLSVQSPNVFPWKAAQSRNLTGKIASELSFVGVILVFIKSFKVPFA